jgi:hypothetical protein
MISIKINNLVVNGELAEIVKILGFYKIPSPVIYQFSGEFGLFMADEKQISCTRGYSCENKLYFIGEFTK